MGQISGQPKSVQMYRNNTFGRFFIFSKISIWGKYMGQNFIKQRFLNGSDVNFADCGNPRNFA